MRKVRLADLDRGGDSVLAGVAPAYHVKDGGVAVLAGGERSHSEGHHEHATPEAFLILEGRGTAEIDGTATEIAAGDVLIVEAGEDHHLVSSVRSPLVTVWLHLG